MKLVVAVLVVASALAGSAAPARAQEQAPVPVSSVEQRSEELSTWLKEYPCVGEVVRTLGKQGCAKRQRF